MANTFSRGTVPSIGNLKLMCSAMGITLAQFFTDNEEYEILTKEETKFIRGYRKLSPTAKKALDDLLSAYRNQ